MNLQREGAVLSSGEAGHAYGAAHELEALLNLCMLACSSTPTRRRPSSETTTMRRTAEATVAPLVGDDEAVLRLLRAHAENRRHGAEFKICYGGFNPTVTCPDEERRPYEAIARFKCDGLDRLAIAPLRWILISLSVRR
ncbi:hypothetical protein ACQJBY_022467 [Aegilops geniculata]